MIAAYQEQIFWHYILDNKVYLNTTKPEFFSNQILKDLFEIAKDHSLRYGEAPSKDQLIELVKIKGKSEIISDDIISALYNAKEQLKNYDQKWIEDNVGPWIRIRNLDSVMRKAIAYMKTSQITAENAAETVEKVRSMLTTETAIDFSFNLGSDFFDPEKHKQTRLARTSTGYDYIDICMKGGYWKGSLIGFLGGPKSGKSTWLTNLAARSVSLGYNTAYITLELQEELVIMRIGSNLLELPLDEYDKIAEDTDRLRDKLNEFKKNSFHPIGILHIKELPSSTASTNDIKAYLKKVQDILGVKFDNVFIDYINIMRNWRNPNTENTYMKIKQISEDLRAIAMEEQWAIITVTQSNRGGWESEDLNLTNVSESAALIHTVDILFGIITSAEMKARSEYYLKCLANRVAGFENTRKRFIIDWKYARIEEDRDSEIEDMDFIINNTINNKIQRRGIKKLKENSNNDISATNIDPDKLDNMDNQKFTNELFQ
ncbi:MAG TPA: DnaB-like helicase C-terminal domain-containing protein [Candidatus Diapherotrites archaeon]|nr:DnaB-like helicase C-terminal domain-containing protein [Candidatus Diapherotrites archaeon]